MYHADSQTEQRRRAGPTSTRSTV